MNKLKKISATVGIGVSTMIFSAITTFASNQAVAVVNSKLTVLVELVTAVASSLGMILTLWGLVEWGISFNDRDPAGQAQAWKRIIGGLIVILAPQLLALLTS